MASGIKDFRSNIRLSGYLDLNDQPLFAGLSGAASIQTDTLNNLLDITNLNGIRLIGSVLIRDNTFNKGAEYYADYSANYTNRSLVDKEYVDNLIVGGNWTLLTDNTLQANDSAINISPAFTNIVDLGTSSFRWNTLYINDSINYNSSLNFDDGVTTIATLNSTGFVLDGTKSFLSTIGSGYLTLSSGGVANYVNLGVDGFNGLTIIKDVLPSGSFVYLIGENDVNIASAFSKIVLKSQSSLSMIGTGVDGDIIISDGTTLSSHSTYQRSPVLISTQNSTVNTGVINTVILGGVDIIASANNTAYVANLELQGNVLGKYTVQPDTQLGWDDLSIPTKLYVDTQIATAGKKSWSWSASRSTASNTNRYLERDGGTTTNQSPYVAWFNCTLNAISLSSNTAGTWTAEVRVNGSMVASLASGGNQYAQVTGLSVAITAGDRVSFYLNGTAIDRPSIDALFTEA